MTDRETLDRARLLFVGDTQGDMLAREVIAIAERATQKAALWEELADQRALEIAAMNEKRDEKWEQVQAEADSASPYSYANPARQTGPYQYVVATKAKPRR